MPRVAVGSIFTECNHLGGTPLHLGDFERGELTRGDALLATTHGTLGGALAALRTGGATILPTVAASTCPGGPLTADCYSALKAELLARLVDSLPVEGVLLALHGSATAENSPDLEGDLLTAVRELVGQHVPVVATLDLHAHVTPEMVSQATALVAWETYPHRDAFQTGARGARLLLATMSGQYRPTMALAKVPVITAALHGGTDGPSPFADVMRFAKWHEGLPGVLSTSVFLVHPYLDLPGMGSGGLVVTDNDPVLARRIARDVARLYWNRRTELEPVVHRPEDAVALGRQIAGGPVLLVETADCCGGGAAGDSVASLKALLAAGADLPAIVPVVDPTVASLCHAAGLRGQVTVDLGHRVDPRWGTPVCVTGVVNHLCDGRFQYEGGIFDGQAGDMGPTAILRVGAIDILVTSRGTYDWNGEQFQRVGLDPRNVKFLVVKNPMNFNMAFRPFATGVFILDTPGPTPASVRNVDFQRLRGPWYPRDLSLPWSEPQMSESAFAG
ncbi:MAG: M81 family metallopeptidase [Planctomycetaceae bacterium]|jgi:microcystin degradation protein MlrC